MEKQLKSVLFILLIFITIGIHAQNLVSKEGFFKSISIDPVLTLYNDSSLSIRNLLISYEIDNKQIQNYEFTGTISANTSVDIYLPRAQSSKGMHYFNASILTKDGKSLDDVIRVEDLVFTISPSEESSATSTGTTSNEGTKDMVCYFQEEEKDFEESVSFWFSLYINSEQQLDSFGSTNHGVTWIPGEWTTKAGLESEKHQATFIDSVNPDTNYQVNLSTSLVPESFIDSSRPGLDSITSTESNYFHYKAYPNPFLDEINLEYTITETSDIAIVIYDTSGRKVAAPLVKPSHDIGVHTLSYNASNLPQGIYWCTIKSGDKSQTAKLIKK